MAASNQHVMTMLKDMASKECTLAAEALANANRMADEAQQKYELLKQYRQGYLDHLYVQMEQGLSAEMYQNFQNFFRKLDMAISGQLSVVEQARQQVKVHQELWQESQRKKLSYDVLIQRTDKKLHQAALKQDQKMMDEHASRSTRARQ